LIKALKNTLPIGGARAKCESTDVYWASGLPQLWSLWDCKNCGYRGPVILQDGNIATKLQEKWKKNKTRK